VKKRIFFLGAAERARHDARNRVRPENHRVNLLDMIQEYKISEPGEKEIMKSKGPWTTTFE
jgi:t-SNARE complex subunit (syntaxin)